MNVRNYMLRKSLTTWLLMAIVLGLAAVSNPAQADLKVVATVSVTGLPPMPQQPPDAPKPPRFPQKVTTYYKGSSVRREIAGQQITILDTATGKGYRT